MKKRPKLISFLHLVLGFFTKENSVFDKLSGTVIYLIYNVMHICSNQQQYASLNIYI